MNLRHMVGRLLVAMRIATPEPPRPKHTLTLHGGPFDGRQIVVERDDWDVPEAWTMNVPVRMEGGFGAQSFEYAYDGSNGRHHGYRYREEVDG